MLLCQTGTNLLKLGLHSQPRELIQMLPILLFGLQLLKHLGSNGELLMHSRSHSFKSACFSSMIFFAALIKIRYILEKKSDIADCISNSSPTVDRSLVVIFLNASCHSSWTCSYRARSLSYCNVETCWFWNPFCELFFYSYDSFTT